MSVAIFMSVDKTPFILYHADESFGISHRNKTSVLPVNCTSMLILCLIIVTINCKLGIVLIRRAGSVVRSPVNFRQCTHRYDVFFSSLSYRRLSLNTCLNRHFLASPSSSHFLCLQTKLWNSSALIIN